jgi:orotate phosphoribosyltransferase
MIGARGRPSRAGSSRAGSRGQPAGAQPAGAGSSRALPEQIRHDDPVDRDELAKRLQEICRLSGRFVLRSGQVSEFYFDKYQFEADPQLLRAVADLAVALIPEGIELLAGLELGGVPVATAMSLATGMSQVLVRKEAKTYGTAKLAEGPDVDGRRVLVVEDVITTGGQVVASTEELRSLGAVVESVLCVIDRRPAPTSPDKLSDAGQ